MDGRKEKGKKVDLLWYSCTMAEGNDREKWQQILDVEKKFIHMCRIDSSPRKELRWKNIKSR